MDEYHTRDIHKKWGSFKHHIERMIKEHVPKKRSRSKESPPWFTRTIKRTVKRIPRAYNNTKKNKKKEVWQWYNILHKEVHKSIRKYINNILTDSLQSKNPKPFWRYIKAQNEEHWCGSSEGPRDTLQH